MAGGNDNRLAGQPPAAHRAAAFDGLKNRAPASAFGWQDGADHAAASAEHTLPGLHGEDRVPWLYSDDDADQAGLDAGRVWGFVLTGFALLALIVGGVWWFAHHRADNTLAADGSVIAAPPGPIKVAPQDPGGKLFDGTGDSSFTVSQGHAPGATLAVGGDQADGGAASGDIQPGEKSGDDAAAAVAGGNGLSGGIGVQVGAFSTQPAAEAAWTHLVTAYDALSGAAHRIVASKADIGTVYGLQAVAGSDAAANALCDRLKAAGLNCQVKD